MPQIKPTGFLEGERMRSLPAEAWCMWTFFYAASNGYGRFQIDYKVILATAFRYFPRTPTETEVYGWLREYKEKDLLFVYRAADGTLWGAFDSKSGQRYFNAEDKGSPAPPEPQFTQWMEAYESKKRGRIAHKPGSVLDDLLNSAPQQHDLGFNVESASNERSLSVESASSVRSLDVEPTQHNTITQHNKTQHNSSSTKTQMRAPAEEKPPEEELGVEAVEEMPNRWKALLFGADSAGMLYAEGELERVRRRWGEYTDAERLAALTGIRMRLDTGEYADAHFVPRLKRYVFEKLWTAKLRAGPRLVPAAVAKKKAATQEFLERMAEDMPDFGVRLMSG